MTEDGCQRAKADGPGARFLPGGASLAEQRLTNPREGLFGKSLHFLVTAILDRMRDKDAGALHPEGTCLFLGRVDELRGGNKCRANPAFFQICKVVHTARGARASISESFNDSFTLDGDFMAKVDRCRLREGRFAVASDLGTLGLELLLQPVEENIPARLGYIKQADGLPGQCRQRLGATSLRRDLLIGRIQNRSLFAQGQISFTTGTLPAGPDNHPPITAANKPAPPPQ